MSTLMGACLVVDFVAAAFVLLMSFGSVKVEFQLNCFAAKLVEVFASWLKICQFFCF